MDITTAGHSSKKITGVLTLFIFRSILGGASLLHILIAGDQRKEVEIKRVSSDLEGQNPTT
jgi:hypothetical protein